MTYKQMAEKVLREVNKPLTETEIWDYVKEKGYDKELKKISENPAWTIAVSINESLRIDPSTPFERVGRGPRRYGIRKTIPPTEVKTDGAIDRTKKARSGHKRGIEEGELYDPLVFFAFHELGVYTFEIDEAQSSKSKKGKGQWMHPDIIGCRFAFDTWRKNVLDFSKHLLYNPIRMYSFELKRELTWENLRESYFQAVSNSTWSNEGYLVTCGLDESKEEFIAELRRLASQYGIGIINVDLNDYSKSRIMVAAAQRDTLDWEFINKMEDKNVTFRKFIERVGTDLRAGEIRKENYLPVLIIDEGSLTTQEKIKRT